MIDKEKIDFLVTVAENCGSVTLSREDFLQLVKERDAAVSNLKQSFSDTYTPCHWCKNNIDGQTCLKEKGFSFSMKCWEWRGVDD